MRFILGVKPGDHAFLFQRLLEEFEQERVTSSSGVKEKDLRHHLCEPTPLNASNPDLLVYFLSYGRVHRDGEPSSSSVGERLKSLVKPARGSAGRTRWKIENETYNS